MLSFEILRGLLILQILISFERMFYCFVFVNVIAVSSYSTKVIVHVDLCSFFY